MPFSIVVDGPNFINDLLRHGKSKDYIMNELSFPVLHWIIQKELKIRGLHSHPFLGTEFICSNKEQLGLFKKDERKKFLDQLKRERGVRVREIKLSSEKGEEKGVDMTVFTTMLERGKDHSHDVVLIGRDKDYVPALQALTKKGINAITIGFDHDEYPIELTNESYLFLDMQELLGKMERARPKTIDR